MAIGIAASIPNSPWRTTDQFEASIGAVIAMLEEIGPRDLKEGMLAAQMVTLHNAAMECMRRAMASQQPAQVTEMYLRNGVRLSSLYERHLASLDKRRGRGQQTIRVEHVTTTRERVRASSGVDSDASNSTEIVKCGAHKRRSQQQIVPPSLLTEQSIDDVLSEEPECIQAVARL